jgi:3-phosphoshikimate 1-carboxyvinyltransferase
MGRVTTPLRLMGASITSDEGERPPLKIYGGKLTAIDYVTPLASAQVKSAVLFAGLFAAGETAVRR